MKKTFAPPPDVSDLVHREPAPVKEYPGINLDVCRQRITNGEPAESVAGWLVGNYPGMFQDAAEALAALERA
jgi:hypothetical protein